MEIFGNSRDGGRQRALMLGIPAVLVSIVGVVLLCLAEFGVAKNLEERYLIEAEKSTKEKERLVVELRRELRMREITQTASVERGTKLIAEDDPRRIELEANRSKEATYLEKLISLNTGEPEYKFKLALASLEREETRGRGLAMLRTISPEDEAGHVQGHVFLAKYYLNTRTSNQAELIQNVKLALTHVDLCLRRESDNIEALQIKAQLLYRQRKHSEAYVVFSKLFKTDPTYFQALVELNQKLKREDRNTEIVSIAIDSFDDELNSNQKLTDSDRVRIFQDLTKCYIAKKDFEGIENRLLKEIKLQSGSPKDTGKRVWAEHLLASVYGSWLQLYPIHTPENIGNRLELLKKAYVYNEKNEYILRELTRLGGLEDQRIAAAARKIYDPAQHSDAPSLVLNELGAQALRRSEYDRALRFFELARKKTPRVPEILNNLSYTYLVGDTPNPKRALKLVDEGLRYLPNTKAYEKYRTHFHDTRGKALMQLGQVSEAVAEFEFSLRGRPDNIEVLESLIKCYQANDMDAGPYERHLSAVVKKKEASNGAESEE